MLLLLLVIIPLLLVAYQEYKYGKMRKQIQHTPGPKMLPFVGNTFQLGKTPNDVLNFMFDSWYEFGQKNFRFWIGYYLNILVGDIKDVEFVLTSNTLIGKSDIYDMLHPWLGDGLLTASGSKWHKHRKMITPTFHFKILQEFQEVMNQNSTKFLEKLRNASKNETIFDFQDMVGYLTLDIICDTAMGVNINAMDNPDSEFVHAVHYLCYNINMRAYHPLKRKLSTYKFFPDYKDYCRNLKLLQDLTYEIIEKRIETRKTEEISKTNTEPNDEYGKRKMAFLDTLLSSTIDGKPLTRQEVYEEVSTFIFEGHDTTTSAITFAVFLLSRHLAVQKKVLEEQQEILGENLKRDATFQELSEMKYLDLVLKECMRIYPSVPLVGRFTEKEYNMNGKIIPPNTSLNLFIMGLGYNEKTFPDPYLFNPERFNSTHTSDTLSPYSYVPFSAGPRNCIGQKFALLEIKIVVSKILRNFEILPALDELASMDGYVCNYFGPFKNKTQKPHKYDPVLSTVLTLKSDNGVFLRLKERK